MPFVSLHSMNVREIQDNSTNIFIMPNEVLDEIVSHLVAIDQMALIQTCSLLHDVGSHCLYRHIRVSSGISGSCLFHTLLHSKAEYGVHTRTLHYGGDRTFYTRTFHQLLVKALRTLKHLVHLSLDVRSTPFYTNYLIKKGIDPSVPDDPDLEWEPSDTFSSLRLNGDTRLLTPGTFSTMKSMTLTNQTSVEELHSLMKVIAPTGQNHVLNELNLTLVDDCFVSMFYDIGTHLPRIKILSIQAPEVSVLVSSRLRCRFITIPS